VSRLIVKAAKQRTARAAPRWEVLGVMDKKLK